MQTKCIDFYMHPFNVTCLLTYLLLTYLLLQFIVSIKYSLKSILLYGKNFKEVQC